MTHRNPFEIEYLCRVDSREPPGIRIVLDEAGWTRRILLVPGARLTMRLGMWDVNNAITSKRD